VDEASTVKSCRLLVAGRPFSMKTSIFNDHQRDHNGARLYECGKHGISFDQASILFNMSKFTLEKNL
jgi:hypothetical protein